MPSYIRLSAKEQAVIDEIALKINRIRLENEEKPLMDSKIIHKLLEHAVERVEVDDKGNLYYRK